MERGSHLTSARRISVVVPTYQEAENLPQLIHRLRLVRERRGWDLELLLMDDDSRDGTEQVVARCNEPWVKLHVRTSDRGLSAAVLDGFRRAEGDVLVCMDADLSHPPEALPGLLEKLDEGADFVIGSRYVDGGSTSDDWGFFRWLNSRVATLLATPFTSAKDPMAGYFARRRETFARAARIDPIGYKIGLELLVKCRCQRVVEAPIHFEDRVAGESKLTLTQQLLYLKHLRRLYVFKLGVWSQLTQFLAVGALGTVVNLALLTLLLGLKVPVSTGAAIAIAGSMLCNFYLNRRFSFEAARDGDVLHQLVTFVAACSVGACINYAITLMLLGWWPSLAPQLAAFVGIVAATAFNFVASRYLVFRRTHIQQAASRAEVHVPSRTGVAQAAAAKPSAKKQAADVPTAAP